MGRSALIAAILLSACTRDVQPAKVPPDGGVPCTAGSHTCLPGTRCTGGFCLTTCTGGTACDPGTYCGGPTAPNDVCAPIKPTVCVDPTDCPFPQGCLSGKCVALEARADGGIGPCALGAVPDGCAPDAVCQDATAQPSCLGLPLCGADGGCPAGSISSACNMLPDGGSLVPGKGRICLLTECDIQSECTSGSRCAHANPAVPFGTCQFGILGDPCLVDHPDCAPALSCLDAGTLPDGGLQAGRCSCLDGGVNADGGCDP
jgi:hypothetical protein